jgi:hypothetical protein
MAISLSPSVTVKETDLTNVVPGVATSIGAAVIEAGWGPVMDVTTVSSENVLVQRFGKPNAQNSANWFAAANFLSYSSDLKIVRSDTSNQRNAVSFLTTSVLSVPVVSGGSGYTSANVTIEPPPVAGGLASIDVINGGGNYDHAPWVNISAPPQGGVQATAVAIIDDSGTTPVVSRIDITNPGSGYLTPPTVVLGGMTDGFANSADPANKPATLGEIKLTIGGIQATGEARFVAGSVAEILITNPGSGYVIAEGGYFAGRPAVTLNGANSTDAVLGAVNLGSGGLKINNESHYEQAYSNGEAVVGEFAAKYPGTLGNSLKVSMADKMSFGSWDYKALFDSAPGTSAYAARNGCANDELHIVIIDKDGRWTGIAGSVLEKYSFLSKSSDVRKEDGSGAYYKQVINNSSAYIWWMDHPALGTNWGQIANNISFATFASAITRNLVGGVDHYTATDGQRIGAFDMFSNAEELDINLIISGKASTVVANWVIQNLAEDRKDCIAFISPVDPETGDALVGNNSDIAEKIVTFRNALPSSSYFVIDSGYKYQYDRYNDAYRWVPLNGDIAGLCARTDSTNDPWFSPAGLNRGQIKNVIKLGYSPRKTDRDTLYKAGINPVVAFPGQGVVLYGDKTGLTKPSAFDRINVRRLFIVLQKAISTAAKYQLFEINDEQTRAQFRATIEPFLRSVQGRRGIYAYKVVCDGTNNTPEVIDTNQFTASIYIQPARTINFIELNFVATRTGVNFEEVAGSV